MFSEFCCTIALHRRFRREIEPVKTSLFTLPDGEMTFHQAIGYVKALGIDAIEPYPHAELRDLSVDEATRLADDARRQGVSVSCFSVPADLSGSDAPSEIKRLQRCADVAKALGSPFLHHTLASNLNLNHPIASVAALTRSVARAAREVYDYAADLGVACVYEDQGFAINGVLAFDAFLGELDRDAGVVLDTGNIFFVGETPESFAARFAPLTRHVHVKDYICKSALWPNPGEGWYLSRDGGYLRGTVIGHGQVNFVRVMSILNAAGYDGFYSIEYDGLEDARTAQRQGLANLRRYMDQARLNG